MTSRLPADVRLGVTLQVADLERSLSFYGGLLGLKLLAREAGRARLGAYDATRSSICINLPARAPSPGGVG